MTVTLNGIALMNDYRSQHHSDILHVELPRARAWQRDLGWTGSNWLDDQQAKPNVSGHLLISLL